MAEINRYSQMPAPLQVNPISFEEFSRVPMAEAIAKGEGSAALSRIKTDFNVDEFDLGHVTKLVTGIEEVKSGIVNKIAEHNIDSQTVSEVLALKQKRDALFNNQIKKAEENKLILNNWRENIDKATMNGKHPADYGELIKAKGYEAWKSVGGTFGKGDDIKTFIPDFGVDYINVDKDVMTMMETAAKQGVVKQTGYGEGIPYIENIPGVGGMLTTPGGSNTTKATNLSNIQAVEDLLTLEYNDPNTERGKFAAYAGKEAVLSQLKERLGQYKKMFLDTKDATIYEGKRRQLLNDNSGGKDKDLSQGTDYNLAEKIIVPVTQIDAIRNSSGASGVINQSIKWVEDRNILSGKREEQKSVWDYIVDAVVPGYKPFTDISNLVSDIKTIKKQREQVDKEKLGVLQDPNFDPAYEVMLEKGIINGKDFTKALAGDQESIDRVFGDAAAYLSTNRKIQLSPSMVTTGSKRTIFGRKVTGVDLEGAAQDAFQESTNYIDYATGEVIKGDSDLDKEITLKGKTGGYETTGVIPMLSPLLVNRETNAYEPNLSGARILTDLDKEIKTNKGVIIKPLSKQERSNPDAIRISEVNDVGMNLKPGESGTLFMTDEGETFYPIEIVRDPRPADPNDKTVSAEGNSGFNFLYRTKPGEKLRQLTEYDMARITSPQDYKRIIQERELEAQRLAKQKNK